MTEAPALISGWERVARFIDELRERLRRATAALTAAGVPYAVVGGNAVAEWVGRADPAGVRNTKDVDILLRRGDLDAASAALAAAGFIHRHVAGLDIFLDGQKGKAREAVHVVFANESLRDDAETPAPDVTESEPGVEFQVVRLEALVRMKLVANRDKDRTHLRDLLDVGLLDSTWPIRFPPPLAERLQAVLDTPNG
jgi:hypothetical protein